ncbi:MAG TPA: response regulator transcription factor [Gaiellaceae bacterium]|nr:response regulator transcription factor [Gaiellaceae bacterium]
MAEWTGDCGPILVVDDDPATVELVACALGRAGFAIVPMQRGDEAATRAGTRDLGGAVLDVNLPGVSGYELCRMLRDLYGSAFPIVFVSGERVEAYDRVAGLLVGADDYLSKPFAPDELVARLRRLVAGRVARSTAAALTRREREVLQLLAVGLGQREIAERLVISSKTVATHIERILGKLGVHSRAQAVAAAYRLSLVAE